MDILHLINREKEVFTEDINHYEKEIQDIISSSSFLVIGGAGSIGGAVVKELFKRQPNKLHVVDINENGLTEIIRDVRSSYGYISGSFKTFVLDAGSLEYEAFIEADGEYDYVLNFSALKHVRSEKDPFTLMRMINVNVINTERTLELAIAKGTKKYFCVSTDKAAAPVNMMGASKRIMEMFLMRKSLDINISTARFANVAFSDGSLLFGFEQRIKKQQPIVAPSDVRRYFVTPKESAELCIMSCLLGDNRDIFFPKLDENVDLIPLTDIAVRYVKSLGYEPYLCETEDEARELVKTLPSQGKWPCLFTPSDTTGEKTYEEFFTDNEELDLERFKSIGIVKNDANFDDEKLTSFLNNINSLKNNKAWTKKDILNLFFEMIPQFNHLETGKYLDDKM